MNLNVGLSKRLSYKLQAAAALGASVLCASVAMAQASGTATLNKAQSVAAIKAAAKSPAELQPNLLGDFTKDNVYTAVTPCRIVDTRVAGGQFGGNVLRQYDVDGPNLSAQGGSGTGCGIPNGVAASVAMTVTVTGPGGPG
jgi:hypothetical protein